MNIETKFNVNDLVFTIKDDISYQVLIREISIYVDSGGIKITYEVEGIPTRNNLGRTSLNENKLFKSHEEAIGNLKKIAFKR